MLKKGQYGLQICTDKNYWKWVFCYNRNSGIITTANQRKALNARYLPYFQHKFGDCLFRTEKLT